MESGEQDITSKNKDVNAAKDRKILMSNTKCHNSDVIIS